MNDSRPDIQTQGVSMSVGAGGGIVGRQSQSQAQVVDGVILAEEKERGGERGKIVLSGEEGEWTDLSCTLSARLGVGWSGGAISEEAWERGGHGGAAPEPTVCTVQFVRTPYNHYEV